LSAFDRTPCVQFQNARGLRRFSCCYCSAADVSTKYRDLLLRWYFDSIPRRRPRICRALYCNALYCNALYCNDLHGQRLAC